METQLSNETRELIRQISTIIAYFKKDEINFARIDLPKFFYETVNKDFLKEGYNIMKTIFPNATPKMLDTNYASFWFYCIEHSCSLEGKEKLEFLDYLAELYVYVHLNSIVRKHVRFNFDYNIWWEAVQRSKSRYLKKGGIKNLVDILRDNTVQRLTIGPYKDYCKNKKLYVKSFYMLRHKVSQIMKPVMEIYYALLEIKRKHKAANEKLSGADITDSATVREFIIWFDEIVEQKEIIEKIKNKRCLKVTQNAINILKTLNIPEKEHIIKMSLKEITDETYWRTDPIINKIYENINIETDFKTFIRCLISVIVEIYEIYATQLHNKTLDNLILLYFLREI